MAKQKDPNKKYYFDQVDLEEIKRLSFEFVKKSNNITVWQKGKNEEHVEHFKCKKFNEASNKLYIEQQKEGLLSSFKKSKYIDKDIFLKIEYGKDNVFTTSRLFFDDDKDLYYFIFKDTIFKSLQRQNYRLNADSKNAIQIKLAEEVIFDGLDISAGGMSFKILESELPEYPKGLVFKKCTLRFNKERYIIEEAIVAGNWPLEDPHQKEEGPCLKIGLSFNKMDPDIEEKLFKDINSVARVREMTKSLLKK